MVKYKTSDYKIPDIYQGGYSSLTPPVNTYSSVGSQENYISAGSLGMTTDPRNANVLKEVFDKLSSGVKQIEIEAVSPEIFDSMPKQYLKEVHRLSKLTGIDISLHGPIIGAAGISQQGYSEVERELAEKKITEALLRAKELNPEKGIPVVFHSAEGIPGSQFLPPSEREKKESDYARLIVVNRETGKMAPLDPETKYYPGMKEELEKGKKYTPEKRIKILNETEWDNSLNQVFFNQERAQEILGKNQVQIQHLIEDLDKMQKEEGKIDPNIFSPKQIQAYNNLMTAKNYLQDIHQQANSFFSKAYEFGTPEQKQDLKKLSGQFKDMLPKNVNPFKEAEAMRFLINELRSPGYTPNMYVPVEEFATEKSAQTFGHAIYDTYKKSKGKNVPITVIENPPAGTALSTGEDIKRIVEESRKKFIERAKKDGMSESQAKREAEKLIGAAWDVGHINMLRGKGYSEEEIIKETEKVAPYVKHIHLSDNFGFEHTELPMGMGNVPLKEMMKKLGKKGFEAKKIIEAASWWQHMKTSPFQEALEGVDSPVYSMKMAPYWSQAPGLYQGYFTGYGQMLPQISYETFGAGFSRLPQELGGQMPGTQGGRMSGRPME